MMTIDERLEKLVERHEALTQTVELMAREIEGIKTYTNEIAEATARLLHIAQIHEPGSLGSRESSSRANN